jgi:hypothetical protein
LWDGDVKGLTLMNTQTTSFINDCCSYCDKYEPYSDKSDKSSKVGRKRCQSEGGDRGRERRKVKQGVGARERERERERERGERCALRQGTLGCHSQGGPQEPASTLSLRIFSVGPSNTYVHAQTRAQRT